LRFPLQFFESFHNIPAAWHFANVALRSWWLISFTLVYFAFLRIPLPRWVKALLALAVSGFAIEIIGNWQGSLSAAWDYLSSLPEMLLLSVVIPALLLIHFRRGNREARILLIFALVLSPEVWIRFLTGLLSLVPAFAPTGQRVTDCFGLSIQVRLRGISTI
jgi:hypothetical protein